MIGVENGEGNAEPRDLPKLQLLTPEYIEAEHKLYVDLLVQALDGQGQDKPRALNIALMGDYGVGKSSILARVRERYEKQVLQVALLTFPGANSGAEQENEFRHKDEGSSEPNSGPNKEAGLQKRVYGEIAKQLIYQVEPEHTVGSKIRGNPGFDPNWSKKASKFFGLGATLSAFLIWKAGDAALWVQEGLVCLGLPQRLSELFVTVGFGALGVLAITYVVFNGMKIFQSRINLKSLTFGNLGVHRDNDDSMRPEGAFDHYFDEIHNLFQTSGRDIVLFEDLDRLDNPEVFYELRNLNFRLNQAPWAKKNPIRFVYALHSEATLKPQKLESQVPIPREVDLQAKVFDLVIPVVPFISAQMSSEVIEELITKSFWPSANVPPNRKRGIGTLAMCLLKVTTDMRTIKSLLNEFEVYKRRFPAVGEWSGDYGLHQEVLFGFLLVKLQHPKLISDARLGKGRFLDLMRLLLQSTLRFNLSAISAVEKNHNFSSYRAEWSHLLSGGLSADEVFGQMLVSKELDEILDAPDGSSWQLGRTLIESGLLSPDAILYLAKWPSGMSDSLLTFLRLYFEPGIPGQTFPLTPGDLESVKALALARNNTNPALLTHRFLLDSLKETAAVQTAESQEERSRRLQSEREREIVLFLIYETLTQLNPVFFGAVWLFLVWQSHLITFTSEPGPNGFRENEQLGVKFIWYCRDNVELLQYIMGLASMEPLESPYSRYLIAALEHYLPNNPTPQVMDNLGKMGFYALRKEIAGFKDFPKVAEWLTKLAGPWRKLDLN